MNTNELSTKPFATLLVLAKEANSPVALFQLAEAANAKLNRNIKKAQFMSFSNGKAAEADHYFQNVIPGWAKIASEITAIWTAAVTGKSTEEIVSIIKEAA